MKYFMKINDTHTLNLAFSNKTKSLGEEFEAIKNFEKSIEQFNKEIVTAKKNYDLNRVAQLKYEKIPALVNEIEIVKKRIRDAIKKAMSEMLGEI